MADYIYNTYENIRKTFQITDRIRDCYFIRCEVVVPEGAKVLFDRCKIEQPVVDMIEVPMGQEDANIVFGGCVFNNCQLPNGSHYQCVAIQTDAEIIAKMDNFRPAPQGRPLGQRTKGRLL